ncbi:MAG: sulfurtransferase [Alphaproteobacteria bacterium]|nr:sulfurtransferase [Alphaproteobacteria bacterium]
MPSPTEITVSQLSRLVGLPQCPTIVDVRTDQDFEADPRLLPGAIRRPALDPAQWAQSLAAKPAVVVCQRGAKLSQGAAAWLRHAGIATETLEGGFEAWKADKQPLVRTEKLPKRDAQGRTVWVTRARPKIDRVACPWLIRRFVDPNAVFLFVGASEVQAVAERFSATPFDIDGVFWSHRGETCTFDTMVDEFGLDIPALRRVAAIVRGADTARLDLAPEAAGLLSVSLGLSRMYRDDLEQLAAAMTVYDSLYRWARDATDETHNWPTSQPAR